MVTSYPHRENPQARHTEHPDSNSSGPWQSGHTPTMTVSRILPFVSAMFLAASWMVSLGFEDGVMPECRSRALAMASAQE